ncbi:Endothelin-2 [Dissostichus eleginoides]|uniref:Endothelin-2 n=1 Tax=Dissostichus eleginoides TaxID=100907 RepID=A0AAD9BB66_DISEL|nr:Endothelin-2 [Dissostichus eleginoides]
MASFMFRTLTLLIICMALQDDSRTHLPKISLLLFSSKLLPYGLGSPLSRRRRSAERCECLNSADKTCSGFCQKSSEKPWRNIVGPLVDSTSTNSNKLLASFRSRVETNTVIAKYFLSMKPRGVKTG